jgi:hypothetical protein
MNLQAQNLLLERASVASWMLFFFLLVPLLGVHVTKAHL